MTKPRPLDDIFEECLELVFKGESIEECLRRFPEHAKELRGLLETAVAARKAVAVEPRAEFRERAHAQMEEALRERTSKAARPVFRWSWQPRWAVAAAAFLVVLVACSGVALAANGSMPGQPLYAVEQAAEHVRLALTLSRVGKANVYAQFANRRVDEIVYLANKGDTARLQQTTQRLQSDLDNVSLLASVAANKSVRYGSATVPGTTVAPTAAPPMLAAPAMTPSPATSTAGNETKWGTPAPPVTVTQAPAPPLITVSIPPPVQSRPLFGNASDPRAALAARIIYQYSVDQAQLQTALANASPETRLALLKAITVSQAGYEKALQSLGVQP